MGFIGEPPGRARELDQLRTLLDDVPASGGLALITGEAGIGKTTLARQLAGEARGRGLAVHWAQIRGEGVEETGGWPWTDLVTIEDARPAHRAGSRSGEVRRWRDGVLGAVDASALPVLLLVDDLHDADPTTMLLLAELTPVLAGHRVGIVATLRPDATADRGSGALADLYRDARLVVELEGLDLVTLAELAGRAGVEASAELVAVLAQRTGGNPFFVTQLLRVLAAGGPHAPQVLAAEVPTQVVEVVRRRLARLRAAAADLLAVAAVLGFSGGIDTLAATADRELTGTLDEFEAARGAGLLEDAGAGRWRFVHALVRDAIMEALPARRRRDLHACALAVLRRGPTPPGELARHALSALPLVQRADAVDLCRAAARASMARYAYEDAVATLEQAVAAANGGLAADQLRELWVELGLARRATGDITAARAAFGQALEVPGEPDRVLLATAALGHADPGADLGLAFGSSGPQLENQLDRALTAVRSDQSVLTVRVLTRLGAHLYFSSQAARARQLAEEAVALAERLGDDHSRVIAGLAYHDAYVVGQVPPADALRASTELLRLARASGDPHCVLGGHRARLFDLIAVGDIDGVDAEIEAFRRTAAELRVPAHDWWLALWRAMRALLNGEQDRAEALATEAYALGEAHFPLLAFLNLGFLLYFLRWEQGRLGELMSMMDDGAGPGAEIPAMVPAKALLLAETGDHDGARGLLARAAVDGYGRLRDRNWPVSWFLLARTAALTGDREQAATLLAAGQPLAGTCLMVSLGTACLGAADLGLAWLAETVGDPAARTWYERAAATNARIGARSWLARAREGLTGSPTPVVGGGVFRADGAVWELSYGGRTVRLPTSKGLADLARLLRRPGEALHVSELLSAQAPETPVANAAADEVFDVRARREIRARLAELGADADEATAAGDAVRAARAKAERDELLDSLSAALGRGGRSRLLGDTLERARKTVTARIRNSIRHIGDEHEPLGRHLDRSVDTGVWCVYRPEYPVTWTL